MDTIKTATKNVEINEKDTDGASSKDKKQQGNKLGHVWLYIQDLKWKGKNIRCKTKFRSFLKS